jgi:prenyltransferase/squalene oxidase-like repeat protein
LVANILEMPDQLPRTDFAAGLHGEFLSFLKTLQNADGGWGFHAGESSRVEPTCWALRALVSHTEAQDTENVRKGAGYLQSAQLPDGSWPACAEMRAGSWITSLTCSVLAADGQSAKNVAAGLKWLCEDFPRDSSLVRRLLQSLRRKSQIVSQNDSYHGWGWTPKTASWVEPTAFALLALRDAPSEQLPRNAAERRDLAVALLYDRMCPGGGWNCGNPRVYGVDGEALVLPTCWALLALSEALEKPGRPLSLAWLRKEFAKIESAASLAVARMTLENYGVERPQAKRDLQDWSAQELAAQGTHVLAWVCLALDPARRWAPAAVTVAPAAAAVDENTAGKTS